MHVLRNLFRGMFFALLLQASQALATAYSIDYSDLWYNANESGWGVNIVQQSDTLFMTFFIYGSDNKPSWYVASSVQPSGNGVFSGALYQTTGPYFGGPFNPNSVSAPQVGTVTFTATTIANATLSYTINGVAVSKSIIRQTWKNNDLSGTYYGADAGTYSGCANSANSGYRANYNAYTITSTATTMHMVFVNTSIGNTCTFSGDYQQYGRFGQSSGTLSCTNGFSGNFTFFAIDASPSGITGLVTASTNICQSYLGQFGGVRR